MAALSTRIGKVEAALNDTRKCPVRFAVINVDAPDADERAHQAIREYEAKYGCLDGLRIVRNHVPEPLQVPSGFK